MIHVLRKALNQAPAYASIRSQKNKVLWLNQTGLDQNGANLDDVVGRRPNDLWSGTDWEKGDWLARKHGRTTSLEYGVSMLGQAHWVKSSRELLRSGHVLWVASDVTAAVHLGAVRASAHQLLSPQAAPPPPLPRVNLTLSPLDISVASQLTNAGITIAAIAATLGMLPTEVMASVMRIVW